APRPLRWLPIRTTSPRCSGYRPIWSHCVRGEVYRLRSPRNTGGHEQSGQRYAVVVQSDLPLSTWLGAPTSAAARPAPVRPETQPNGRPTRVLVEQTVAIDPTRLGDLVAQLPLHDMSEIDNALRVVLGLT